MDNYGSRGGGGGKYQSMNKNSRDQKYRRSHDDDMYSERDRNDDYYNKKSKKPDQNYYHGKQQQQSSAQGGKSDSSKRYEGRQTSEPRLMSNNSNNNNNNYNSSNQQDLDRNRAPKVSLPPSGQQRINNAAFRSLPMNIDSLPPRLKRKYLKDAGLPEDLADNGKPIMEQQASYSLPFGNQGGRGYNQQNQSQNRYDQYHPQQNFQSKYNNNQNHHSYHNERPTSHHRSRSITPTRPPLTHQQKHQRNEWKVSNNVNNNVQQTHHQPVHNQSVEEYKNEKPGASFDWSEDVLNSQSLPYDINSRDDRGHGKFDDNHRQRNRRRRNRSASSNGSVERTYPNNADNFQNVFKMPFPKSSGNNRQRRNSQSSYNSRDNSMERSYGGYNSRENSLDRRYNRGRRYQNRRGSDNYSSSRENSSERYANNWTPTNNNVQDEALSWRRGEIEMSRGTDQKIAELTKQFENSVELNNKSSEDQRVLFDPSNPTKPIVVKHTQSRPREFILPDFNDHQQYLSTAKPNWFKKSSEQYQKMIKSKCLIDDLSALDDELMQLIVNPDKIISQWTNILEVREKIQKIFEELLRVDMRFCQSEHVEHYFWKLLFYHIIEILRKLMQECGDDENAKSAYKEKALEIIDIGTKYLESLLIHLETCHKFKIENFTGDNAASYKSGLGYVGLALVSAQKIFLFLGDLARYREQFNLTNNFGRAKNYYVKAQQIVPKNGRPFNQLALLAVYSKRKIDAVYFYMRSLMSSNPFLSAKESLVALFDEIRKKYEFSQRKREEKNRLRLKEKEHRFDGNLRKETWIHPDGGSRVHRTGPLDCTMLGKSAESSDDEELDKMEPSELNKRFIISFLHVQGKLITKIGMESFHMCATQMLKEFRALLHISPIPINSHRILQLLSLNMYAIDCNALKCTESKDSSSTIGSNMQARSEVQECAITVALLMFGIIVERFIEVLRETLNGGSKSTTAVSTTPVVILSDENHKKINNNVATKDESKKILKLNEDSKVILPAIKVWTDWMFHHENVWNPPPYSDYKIGATSNHDPWNGLASLMTLLETVVDANRDYLVLEKGEDCELVRLSEDITLAGFTPLNKVTQDPIYCRSGINIENAQNSLRLQKLMFFGTDFLCKCKPQPILKKLATGEYISIVQNRAGSASDTEILLESFSDEEEGCKEIDVDIQNETSDSDKKNISNDSNNDEKQTESQNEATEIRRLLRRKDELERKQRMQERYNERLQDILSHSNVALHIEVRPRFLIPDTNTFIDDLELIKKIANAYPLYQLMIPIVVINELEGLSRGMMKQITSTSSIVVAPALCEKLEKQNKAGSRNDPKHAEMVTQACKSALAFLKSKNPAVKSVTTKGSILTNTAIFTSEDGPNEQKSNDDKILDTALNLSKKNVEEKKGEVRFIKREVVLLTTDRNLRVKALTNDIPVRELRDFIRWSGLGS